MAIELMYSITLYSFFAGQNLSEMHSNVFSFQLIWKILLVRVRELKNFLIIIDNYDPYLVVVVILW